MGGVMGRESHLPAVWRPCGHTWRLWREEMGANQAQGKGRRRPCCCQRRRHLEPASQPLEAKSSSGLRRHFK
jgi:hypothetical protein